MMKKLQDRSKKGFTLVELVVVLVILAILATLLVPSLSGYIDKAKEKRVVAEVHQVVVAAQTLADEIYALEDEPDFTGITTEKIAALAEIKGTVNKVAINIENGKVSYAEVTRGGVTGYYGENEDTIITSLMEDYGDLKPDVPDDESEDYCVISAKE